MVLSHKKRSHSRDYTHGQTVDYISSVWLLLIKVEQTGKRHPLGKLAHATSPTELGLTTRNNIGFYLYYYFDPSTMIAAEFVTTDMFPFFK